MYFHYTSGSGANAIRQCGYIHPSEESGSFGPGVYLTDLDPNEFFRDEILRNNYGGIASNFRNRADWVVAVFEKNLNMQLLRRIDVPDRGNRRIYVYPTAITVSAHQIYDKPTCYKHYTVYESDFADEDPNYNDSTDDITGSDEFDTDNVLSEPDESDYGDGGEDEEFEETSEHQMDEIGSYGSEEEGTEYSENDSNDCEETDGEEDGYEETSGGERNQYSSEDVQECECDDGSGEDYDGEECSAGDDYNGEECSAGDNYDGDECSAGDDYDGDEYSAGDDHDGDECSADDDYNYDNCGGYSDCYDESDGDSY